ncbi:monovalent cation:proton antiporter-2 (CPA2) family protein [Shewanella yunxiaonensis]|uniref:Monovalent cation:proton antiporter-2 (CPA2) family protein n=1 Tax=Shewanella yunxiaonensis TaxID=2829809 RepID=A0ABX7YPS7_9GAMM|nr:MULTISPECIES: monovalent cation:proton antiporter-2 (CPA2) family protein [Shewanella]MDF0534814.1 monovalent cation:proton antiporter-2 (CPA2) family protein [Shewanella sp. A32]QUN04768.1 monovalent cation:proton antiporter-2 (CPA2) family protein [Shewanella yunxiaonensis]
MEQDNILISTLLFLLAGVVLVPLGKRFGVGPILSYLAAGVILGPAGIGVVSEPQSVLHFAEFGVVLMLFMMGLQLSPGKLWELRSAIFGLGSGQLLLSWAAVAIFSAYVGLSWPAAIIIGAALSLSSTAFAVQLMTDQRLLTTPVGRDAFGVLLMQDLAVIPMLLLTAYLAPNAADAGHRAVPWYWTCVALLGFLLMGKYLLPRLLQLVAASGVREVLTAFSLLLVMGSAALMAWLGLSSGMGAFLAGVLLANSSYRHQLETDIDPFKGLLLGLFFMAVGMSMDLSLLLKEPLLLLGILLAMLAIKTLVLVLLGKLRRHAWRSSVALGLILAEGGEFAFVLLSQAHLSGLLSQELSQALVLVIGLSMAVTPYLLRAFRATGKPAEDHNRLADVIDPGESEVVIAGFGRMGQITGRILASTGIPFVALDKDARHVDVVRQFGSEVYFGDAKRLDMLLSAGLTKARVILITVDSVDDSLEIVNQVQTHFPHVTIVARARDRNHAYRLMNMGVTRVFRETFGSALSASESVLQTLGMSQVQASERVRIFAEHDKAQVVAGAEHKDDLKALIRISNEGKAELESLMRADRDKGI